MRDPKGEHIGRALEQHRRSLGVTIEQMTDATEVDSITLRAIEVAPEPTDSKLRVWWTVLDKALTEDQRNRDTRPAARREQFYTTDADEALFNAAVRRRPGVYWWWGSARTARGTGAVCYLCGTLFHTYDIGRGVTFPVRLSVMRHRADHLMGKIPAINPVQKGSTL